MNLLYVAVCCSSANTRPSSARPPAPRIVTRVNDTEEVQSRYVHSVTATTTATTMVSVSSVHVYIIVVVCHCVIVADVFDSVYS